MFGRATQLGVALYLKYEINDFSRLQKRRFLGGAHPVLFAG